MSAQPWHHNEVQLTAVTDYHAREAARNYDARMATIRDVAKENVEILEILRRTLPNGLNPQTRILEIGTGTGAFARSAAPFCGEVVALDVAQPMLDYAKSRSENFPNIRWEQAGFLSYDEAKTQTSTFDATVSSLALHHLNDVWKAEAVANLARLLKPGGVFVLVDVVFHCEGGELDRFVSRFVSDEFPDSMKQDLYGHIAKEDSTFDWIMRGILERAGFEIQESRMFNSIATLYVCVNRKQ